jgi:hypothetical protein
MANCRRGQPVAQLSRARSVPALTGNRRPRSSWPVASRATAVSEDLWGSSECWAAGEFAAVGTLTSSHVSPVMPLSSHTTASQTPPGPSRVQPSPSRHNRRHAHAPHTSTSGVARPALATRRAPRRTFAASSLVPLAEANTRSPSPGRTFLWTSSLRSSPAPPPASGARWRPAWPPLNALPDIRGSLSAVESRNPWFLGCDLPAGLSILSRDRALLVGSGAG